MSVHDTKIQDFTNVLKQFYAKVKALIPTKVSQLTNDSGYKTTDTTYTNFVKSGSGAKAGLVPAPPTTAGTSKYLREDGTWQVTPAAVTPVNNLLATTAGSPLDAVQGKVLNDKIDGVNSSLKGFEPILDDTGKITGYKTEIGGADTVFPFSGSAIKDTVYIGGFYNSNKSVTYTFDSAFTGYLVYAFTSHSPAIPVISFDNSGAYYEIVSYGGKGNVSAAWGGGWQPGYIIYKVDIPAGTTITCGAKVSDSAIFFIIDT